MRQDTLNNLRALQDYNLVLINGSISLKRSLAQFIPELSKMAIPHPHTTLPNHPNYYWEMALQAFDENKIWECDMYLILYTMAIAGE